MAGRLVRLAVLLLGLARGGALQAQESADDHRPALPADFPARATVLDVPYFAQTELLCGGAAAAMVLRYWGMVGVRADDFAGLVRPSRGGMRADELAARIRELGWEVFPFAGDFDEVRRHLRLGRPVISLLEVAGGRFHYVVLVGEAGDRLVVHDPAGAPYRLVGRVELEDARAATDGLSLLVLPSPDRFPNVRPPVQQAASGDAPTEPGPSSGRDALPAACRGRLDRGLSAAAAGRLAEADDLLAEGACAGDPVFLRELAGVRLRRGRAADAVDLARRAVASRPDDAHAARTLATALYVDGHPEAALDAWNRIDEPTVDLVRVAGLERVDYRPAARLLGLGGGGLLTPRRLALARRRLASLPAAGLTRVTYAPTGGGRADVVAALVERPGLPTAPVPLAALAVRAAIYREIRVSATSPLGLGETWTGAWRWWRERPAVSFELAAPAAVGPPAVWTLLAGWERETYGLPGDAADPRPREDRARAELRGRGWLTPDLRLGMRAGLDRWREEGSSLRGGLEAEVRAAGGRVRLGGSVDRWFGLSAGPSFTGASAYLKLLSDPEPTGFVASGRTNVRTVSEAAPRTEWAGAGGGIARPDLLRAHSLLDGGVLTGRVFDRHLASAGAELVRWIPVGTALRAGPAGFVDVAHSWGERPGATRVDVGFGLRLTTSGGGPVLRLDVATGLSDEEWAISAAWSIPD